MHTVEPKVFLIGELSIIEEVDGLLEYTTKNSKV